MWAAGGRPQRLFDAPMSWTIFVTHASRPVVPAALRLAAAAAGPVPRLGCACTGGNYCGALLQKQTLYVAAFCSLCTLAASQEYFVFVLVFFGCATPSQRVLGVCCGVGWRTVHAACACTALVFSVPLALNALVAGSARTRAHGVLGVLVFAAASWLQATLGCRVRVCSSC
jgi:hypothetical protein